MPTVPNQISLRANWTGITPSPKTVQALQVISYGTPIACPTNLIGAPNDIAIIQVGLHDFGRPDVRPMKLHDQRPMANLAVTAYGRGINALAYQAGPTAVPTVLDGLYRTADFNIGSIFPNASVPPATYSYPGNKGATVAGGDSGGPSYIHDWDDPLSPRRKLESRLLGVHSFCGTNCLSGQSCAGANAWTWVASVRGCSDAAILPVRSAILAAIEAVPPDTGYVGTFPTAAIPDFGQKRALYAMSLDEPLVSDAAIDVQLTFKRCHDPIVGTQGCPVTPELEQWGYDSYTHWLVHESGKCVNISGARRDAGSPVILYPCGTGANDKWTIASGPPSPAIWSIKSDLTGMCLHAVPGHQGQGRPPLQIIILRAPATLVQMPCNGSDAQRFGDVDADSRRRNSLH